MSASLDQDALATLTPEEIEAINSDDMDPAERAAMERIASEAGDDDDDSEGDDDDDDSGGDGADAPAGESPVASEKQDPAPAPAAAAETPAPVAAADTTVYTAELPEDYQAKVDDLAAREADLKSRFKAGDIEIDEYDEERSKLFGEREQLNAAKLKSEIAADMNAQSAQRQWQREIDRLVTDAARPERGGIDYRNDPDKSADLDGFVRMLAGKAENADKSMAWFLDEAHRRVLALHGIATSSAKAASAGEKGKQPEKPAAQAAGDRRKPPVDAAPRTLVDVPGGDGPGDVSSEFSHLDSLEGDALESAIARMSDEQRSRYLRGL